MEQFSMIFYDEFSMMNFYDELHINMSLMLHLHIDHNYGISSLTHKKPAPHHNPLYIIHSNKDALCKVFFLLID